MGFSSLFGFPSLTPASADLPALFNLSLDCDTFTDTDILNVYSKILTDCIERTQGIPEEVVPLLWDNCLQSESSEGLISLLAWSMANMDDLFLVYKPDIGILREAGTEEEKQIRIDYETKGFSDIGIFISFKNYYRTDMISIYTTMEYCVVASLNKMSNLSKAIKYQMSDMRGSISLSDSSVAIEQAKTIAKALAAGKDIMIDKNDEVSTTVPDITAIAQSITFLDSKKAFYYGMPLSYINGEQTPGIGSTGEADTKAVERGLKQYYISILKPVLEVLFEIKTSFKSNDFRQIKSGLEAMKIFELVSNDLMSLEQKKLVITKLFDLDDGSGNDNQVSTE